MELKNVYADIEGIGEVFGGITGKLEKALREFDRVILLDTESDRMKNFIKSFCGLEACTCIDKSVLVLSACELLPNAMEKANDGAGFVFRQIDGANRDLMIKLYYMYDFSDKFILLSDSTCFGGLLNYIDTGVLTAQEALDTFFR